MTTHIPHIIASTLDLALTSSDKAISCYLVMLSDDGGAVATDAEGRNICTPAAIGDVLGIPESTARRALAHLHDLGYLVWHRPSLDQKIKGVPGTIRIVFPASGQ